MWLKYTLIAILISFAVADEELFYNSANVGEIKPSDNFEALSFRLPNNTVPIHYDVWISSEIHVPNFDFNGVVTINIRVVEDSSEIVLNYDQLNIINVDLLDSNRMVVEHNLPFQTREAVQMFAILPRRRLLTNEIYHLRITYRGVLRTDNFGVYRASYIDDDGNVIWYVTTQFQAVFARHAFPCYDEPRYRTSFVTMLRHHPRYRAVSNMPVESVFNEPGTGMVVTTFQRIPNMQTYLNAYLISDFQYAENTSVVPPQRIYAKPSSIRKREYEFALRESPKILLGCEQYYNVNYTFPKLDQVAVTAFNFRAMEDWGLITYLEPFLLFDPLVGRQVDIDNIITIVAHEIMHQFIGNIVVLSWWSYIWLNEGTAMLDMYYIPHLVYPNDRYDDSFISNHMQRVMIVDANPNIRAMSHYIEEPAIIMTFFDDIAYPKAGSVLHTFKFAFGELTYRKGLHYYIMTRYNNIADPSHFYAAMQMAVDEDFPANHGYDMATLMSSWELQPGFPVLTVTRNGDEITIRQERFFYDINMRSASLWQIPINFVVASNPDFRDARPDLWLNGLRTIRFNNANSTKQWTANDWMIFNIRQNYYYRVNYDSNLWRLLIQQLNGPGQSFNQIHYRNRAQLIDDAFHLAQAEQLDYGTLLRLMDYLWREMDHHPRASGNRAKVALNRWLSGSIIYARYQEYVRRNMISMFNLLGVQLRDSDHRLDRLARIPTMELACQAQLPTCLQQTNDELTAAIFHGRRIGPDYIPVIYCQGMRTGNGLLFVQMQNRLLRSTVQAERNNIITGLGCSQNSDLLLTFLNLAVTPNVPLTLAEKQRILTAPAPHGEQSLRVMIDFTNLKFTQINLMSEILLNTILSNIANHIGSESLFNTFINLLDNLLRNQAITQANFNTHRTNARVILNWQDMHLQSVIDFFYPTVNV